MVWLTLFICQPVAQAEPVDLIVRLKQEYVDPKPMRFSSEILEEHMSPRSTYILKRTRSKTVFLDRRNYKIEARTVGDVPDGETREVLWSEEGRMRHWREGGEVRELRPEDIQLNFGIGGLNNDLQELIGTLQHRLLLDPSWTGKQYEIERRENPQGLEFQLSIGDGWSLAGPGGRTTAQFFGYRVREEQTIYIHPRTFHTDFRRTITNTYSDEPPTTQEVRFVPPVKESRRTVEP
jgi:hypothetical protein